MRGGPHAEVEALADAAARGEDVRGSTLYVTLEPCAHEGLTPPCTAAVIGAGIARVVLGTMDPNPRTAGAGAERLRAAGLGIDVAEDEWSRALIEDFALAVVRGRPYVRLKLATSLDGRVAPRPGERHWLTGAQARDYVREQRAAYDAVLVGAGTVRIDDPQLSVRPPRERRRPYVRVVACERDSAPVDRAVFAPLAGYERTIVLAPAGARERFRELETVAEVIYVGAEGDRELDLGLALGALHTRGIMSVFCEGGPTLAGRLLEAGLVDRLDWLIAPALLCGPGAVAALAGGPSGVTLKFERVESLGPDVLLTAIVA